MEEYSNGRHLVIHQQFDIGTLPILIVNGCPVKEQVHYVRYLQQSARSQSSLLAVTNSIGLLCDFWRLVWKVPVTEDTATAFTAALWEALFTGNSALGWEPVRYMTANMRLEGINKFQDFCHTDYGHPAVNPQHLEAMSPAELEWVENQQRLTNLFFHLTPATKTLGHATKKVRAFTPVGAGRRFMASHMPVKCFPVDHYGPLISTTRSVRDKLLWILLGMGGLRASETLHLFLGDIGQASDGTAQVVIGDSQRGLYPVLPGSTVTQTTREALLLSQGLKPRDKLAKNDPLFAGWKGMLIEDGKTLSSSVHWLLPEYGRYFWELHTQYLKCFRLLIPQTHPYYFVSLNKGSYGEPLKLSNLGSLFRAAAARIGVISPQNPHSLRHFYGSFAHDILEIPMPTVQHCMRHKSIASSEVYAKISSNTIREQLAAGHSRFQEVYAQHSNLIPHVTTTV